MFIFRNHGSRIAFRASDRWPNDAWTGRDHGIQRDYGDSAGKEVLVGCVRKSGDYGD
jgi:hypothetical protein